MSCAICMICITYVLLPGVKLLFFSLVVFFFLNSMVLWIQSVANYKPDDITVSYAFAFSFILAFS